MQKTEKMILIVEDELLIAENIAEFLSQAGYSNVAIAVSVDEAVKAIELHQPDIVFTDIAMGTVKNGIDLGHLLNTHYKIPFIYITSHSSSQIVLQAKHTFPSTYLTKPFKKEDIIVALELTLFEQETKLNSEEESITFKDGHGSVKILKEDIVWLEADKNYTEIMLFNKKRHVVRTALSDIHSQLPSTEFIRIHKSFVVNWKFIRGVKNSYVITELRQLPIGRSFRDSLTDF